MYVNNVLNILNVTKRKVRYKYKVPRPVSPVLMHNDINFRKRYRFSQEGFNFILDLIKDKLGPREQLTKVGRPRLTPEVS